MKHLLTAVSAIALTTTGAFAQSLMLDFGPNGITAGAETTSPGHAVGGVPLTQTTWNGVTGTAPVSSLNFADGTAATGITLTTGQEAVGGDNIVNFSTAITNLGLAGTGGAVSGRQSLLGAGSIYGQNTPSVINTPGRDGFFGGGLATSTGAAIGLRIDGLAVGDYVIYVMARNTNSNDTAARTMNIFTSVGASSGTFDFSSLTPVTQANTTYTTGAYAGEYTTFTAGENYVAVSFSIASGQSLFLAIDGAALGVERRGFLNSVQIVAVPEPAEVSLLVAGGLGLFALIRRRRTA